MKPFWSRHPYLAVVYMLVMFIPIVISKLWQPFTELCEDYCREIGLVVHFIRTGKEPY